MKSTLILICLFFSLTVAGTTYYIDPAGSNSNTGSSTSPWKTLSYACSKAITPGDIIHVKSGTFIETSQCNLRLGVSITGEGNSSIIHSNFSSGNLIELYSSAVTNGNQSISYVQIEGGTDASNIVGNTAIEIYGRGNVSIHHCTIQHFSNMGVIFYGGSNIPQIYPTGNQFYNNIMTNCSKMNPGDGNSGQGSLCIGSEQGMLVYNNTITCNSRPSGYNGYCIKYCGDLGVNKGLKIYNNTLTADQCPSVGYNFAIEMWYSAGGCEIYNNRIKGTIDIPNSYKDLSGRGVPYPEGKYTFGTKIYNNIIGWDSPMPITNGDGEFGIRLEANQDYTLIYNNRIKNVSIGIECNMDVNVVPQSQNNVNIYYNIFENIGPLSDVGSKGWGIRLSPAPGTKYDNWNILNNVFSAKTSGGSTMWAVNIIGGTEGGIATNINIRNNIIQNFSYAPIACSLNPNPTDKISIENNILYNNGNNNAVRGDISGWQNYTNQNNKPGVLPQFVSVDNFHIQSNSPAINAGLDVGLTTDHEGNSVQKPPDIGAYEYSPPVPPVYQSAAIENEYPSLLKITYDLSLNNIGPSPSAFKVQVNGTARTVSLVEIKGNIIQLTLATPVIFTDVVTVAYTVPTSNPIQTLQGGVATYFSSKAVTNNCKDPTKPIVLPVVVINSPSTVYEGFVSEIDATATYSPIKDPLKCNWSIPYIIPISVLDSLKTRFLAPEVNKPTQFDFKLNVSDAQSLVTKTISINVLPYKPNYIAAKIEEINASNFQTSNPPSNAADSNKLSYWSSYGDKQWLSLKLSQPFKINYIELVFLIGQNYQSMFDVYASKDNINWDPILSNVSSCKFSGDRQVFDFPASSANTDYTYIKYVGHGSLADMWNRVSDLKIYGTPVPVSKPGTGTGTGTGTLKIVVYPNPASSVLYVSIMDQSLNPDRVSIMDTGGRILFEKIITPENRNFEIPINLKDGIYLMALVSNQLILYTQRIIVKS